MSRVHAKCVLFISLLTFILSCEGGGYYDASEASAFFHVSATEVQVGTLVEFDASGSVYDEIQWFFNGSTFVECDTQEVCSKVMDTAGQFEVTLRVVSGDIEDTFSAILTVLSKTVDARNETVSKVEAKQKTTATITSAAPNEVEGIDAANLRLWLDASDASTVLNGSCSGTAATNGQTVDCWKDKSDYGHNLTDDGSPTYSTSAINSKGGITFSGSQYFESQLEVLNRASEPDSDDTHSIFVVARTNSSSGDDDLIGTGATSTGGILMMIYNGRFRGHYWDSGSSANAKDHSLTNTPAIQPSNTGLFYQEMGNDQIAMFLNGIEVITPTALGNTATDSPKKVYVGYRGTGTSTTAKFNGIISEVIIYDTKLSATQRKQVEKHLANKWGFYLPDADWINNYSLPEQIAIHTGRLSESDVSTASLNPMKLWVDADDATTISNTDDCLGTAPADGGDVACWKDKSPSAHNLTQSSGSRQPSYETSELNNRPMIQFNGSSDYLDVPGSSGTFISGATHDGISVFAVIRSPLSVADGTRGGVIIGNYNATADYNIELHTYGRLRTYWNASPSLNPYKDIRRNTGVVLTSLRNTSSITHYLNGGSIGTGSAGSAHNFPKPFRVGDDLRNGASSGIPFNGYIAELIVYDGAVSDANRQRLENHLMEKWGLYTGAGTSWISSLSDPEKAAVHGYKLSPGDLATKASPIIGWYDASDTSTLYTDSCSTDNDPLDGADIQCWKDKSPRAHNLDQGGARPNYESGELNSLGVMRFASGDYLYRTTFTGINTNTYTIFFVGYSSASGGNFMALTSGSNSNHGFRFHATNDQMRLLTRVPYGGSGGTYYTTSSVTDANTQSKQWTFFRDGNTAAAYAQGNSSSVGGASVGTSNFNAANYFTMGRLSSVNGAAAITGDIAEMIIYNVPLSTEERERVEDYLINKWGL